MSVPIKLTGPQIQELAPFFGQRENNILVASIFADGDGYSLQIHAIPAERRLAIRAACDGSLKLPRAKKPKPAAAA